MKKEIRYRLNGLEFIVHNLHHNAALMKYMSFNLHKEPFNLFNNTGLYWIWGQTINNQILDFYKVMGKDEKFSFSKIINIAKELKSDVNYKLLEKETNALKAQYDKTDFEKVRSKYVAHQDLRVPQIRTDLLTMLSLSEKIIEVFLLFSKELKGRKVNLSNLVVKSFDEIFRAVDEYEWVKAVLIGEQIKGNKIVKISEIASSLKEHQKAQKKRGLK